MFSIKKFVQLRHSLTLKVIQLKKHDSLDVTVNELE